jgi:predicted molibdopterin-dependent oxidoreductase YjgC
MKKNGKLEPVSWNEALKVVADQLKPQMTEKDGVAAIVSTRLSAETLTAFKDLFAGNELVTSIEEGVPTASVSQFAQKQGAFEGRLDMLKTADTVLCIGTDIGRTYGGGLPVQAQPAQGYSPDYS